MECWNIGIMNGIKLINLPLFHPSTIPDNKIAFV